MNKDDTMREWTQARAALEALIKQLPEMEKKQAQLSRSQLACDILHHRSLMESSWEMQGILEQKLRSGSIEGPDLERITRTLSAEARRYAADARAIQEKMAQGGFADADAVWQARLDGERKKCLELELELFSSRYAAALQRCEAIDAMLEEKES